jgi:hypothetical protein
VRLGEMEQLGKLGELLSEILLESKTLCSSIYGETASYSFFSL